MQELFYPDFKIRSYHQVNPEDHQAHACNPVDPDYIMRLYIPFDLESREYFQYIYKKYCAEGGNKE
jgi:hypothetical protein